MKLYMFRGVPLSIIRSLFTVHSATVYENVIQVCRQLSSRTMIQLLQTCMTYSYTSAECTVNKLLMMDRGTVSASSWFYYKYKEYQEYFLGGCKGGRCLGL
jgi:hypothetical protein